MLNKTLSLSNSIVRPNKCSFNTLSIKTKKIEVAQRTIINAPRHSKQSLCNRAIKYLKNVLTGLLKRIRTCFSCCKNKETEVAKIPFKVSVDPTSKQSKNLSSKAIEKKQINTEIAEEKGEIRVPEFKKLSDNETFGAKVEEKQNIPQLPQDIISVILSFLKPKHLRKTSLINREYQKLSDKKKIDWLNENEKSVLDLRLNFEHLPKLLKKVGGNLRYLCLPAWYTAKENLELIKCCPNPQKLIVCRDLNDSEVEQMINLPNYSKLETFIFDASATTQNSIDILASSPNFSNLRTLELKFPYINLAENKLLNIEPLVKSSNFPLLENFVFNRFKYCYCGLKSFASSQNFSKLKRISIAGLEKGNEEIKIFAKSQPFLNLQIIRLPQSKIYADGIQAFANSLSFPNLRKLDLNGNEIGDKGLEALANSSNFPYLQKLNLSWNNITNEGLKAFAASTHFPHLEELRIFHNRQIGDEGYKALATSPHFPKLKTLVLSDISDESIKTFALSSNFQELEKLRIWDKFSNEGLKALANSSHFPKLKFLDLSWNRDNINDQGFKEFANSANFPKLEKIKIQRTSILKEGIEALAVSPHFPNLKSIEVDYDVDEESISTLQGSAHYSNLEILYPNDILEKPGRFRSHL